MPKKNFKDSTSHLDRFFSETQGTQEIQWTNENRETHNTPLTEKQSTSPSPKYYRLNLKLKAEHREYLERVSWEARKSITQYINDLVEADRDTRDILDT